MAANNIPQNIAGSLPRLGSRLDVSWGFAGYLLGSIAVVHCVLSALAFYVNWKNKQFLNEGEGMEVYGATRRG